MENENNFIEGEDFEITADGKVVMTEKYLSKRGRCCSSGCMNCPYGFTKNKNIDPTVPQEYQDNWSNNDDLEYEKFNSYGCEDDGQFKMDFEFRG